MQQKCPIAVVGVSTLYPGSDHVTGFWHDIIKKHDQIREIPESYWLIDDYFDTDPKATDKTYGKRGAFIDPVNFDCIDHGILPAQIQDIDTIQLMSLIVAQSVLRDAANGDFSHLDRSRMSVILGVAGGTEQLVQMGARLQRPIWLKSLREAGIEETQAQTICDGIANHYVPWTEASFPGLLGNVVAGRIANRFDLGGTNCVVDAACASSLSALSMAVNELYLHHSDMVITGGADTLNDILMFMCFSKTPALSPTGDCRPFSGQADGTILGEGVGMLALRRLDDAERDGDTIYAVIKGVGSSSDGSGTAVYAPVSNGQAQAINRAYQEAGFDPRTIELIEAHGTGTKAGDKAEFAGLNIAFGEGIDNGIEAEEKQDNNQPTQWCALGSIKSQIGHTKGAAGAAALIKTVLALHHKVLPPTIKVDQPNPSFNIKQTPFYINTQARPWVRDKTHPRRAGVSSFGFGGSNFHVAVEEYCPQQKKPRRMMLSDNYLVVFGDASIQELINNIEKTVAGFPNDNEALEYLARSTQEDFLAASRCRIAFVVNSITQLAEAFNHFKQAANKSRGTLETEAYLYSEEALSGKVAVLFPGQGSQYIGMGSALAMSFTEAMDCWDLAECIRDNKDSLSQLVFPRPCFEPTEKQQQINRLNQTEWTQPAIGATSLSFWSLLKKINCDVDGVAGHSYGELTALCAAHVYDQQTLLQLARKRGELMAQAGKSSKGCMTAIKSNAETVENLIETIKDVSIANYNSPEQVVATGTSEGIECLEQACKTANLFYARLPVSTAFHSSIVASAVEPFVNYLKLLTLSKPTLTVYANKTAEKYPKKAQAVTDLLSQQLVSPVKFSQQIETMYEQGYRLFIELGPNNILSKLTQECLQGKTFSSIAFDKINENSLTTFWRGIAQLCVAGKTLNLRALWADFRQVDDPKKRPEPKLALPISGINYNRIYPPKEGASSLPKPNSNNTDASSLQVASHSSSNNSTPSNTTLSNAITHLPETPQAQNVKPHPQRSQLQAQTQPQDSQPVIHAADPWLQAFESIQQQTNETHRRFLALSEQALHQLGQLSGNSSAVTTAPQSLEKQAHQPPLPPVYEEAVPNAVSPNLTEANNEAQPQQRASYQTENVSIADSKADTTIDAVNKSSNETTSANINAKMLAIVAEKTGYPLEMLQLSMSLEDDLGIDSIKRVEILSATMEQLPQLSDVNPTDMASLKTLQEIVDFIGQHLNDSPENNSKQNTHHQSDKPVLPPKPNVDSDHIKQIILKIIAEKTGYPLEMIEPPMELENDLGIDSIKRVEILSATMDKLPDLPEFEAASMSSLSTIAEIIDLIKKKINDRDQATTDDSLAVDSINSEEGPLGLKTVASTGIVIKSTNAESENIETIMLAVVAEKTGYPIDMLEPTMDLENDLGIDSIKRVEILSATTDKIPDLPDFDASQMSSLSTLSDIITFIETQLKPESVPAPTLGENKPQEYKIEDNNHTDESKKKKIITEQVLSRYTLELTPFPLPGLTAEQLLKADCLSISPANSIYAKPLADALNDTGCKTRLVEKLCEDDRFAISLDALTIYESREEAIAINRRLFEQAITVAKSHSSQPGVFILVQNTGGNYGQKDNNHFNNNNNNNYQAWAAGGSALCKTAAYEWPHSLVRNIDIELDDSSFDLGERLANEILYGAAQTEIALSAQGERCVPVALPKPQVPESKTAPLSSGDVLLVTGGGRGVTATSIKALCEQTTLRVALLGRTELSDTTPYEQDEDHAALMQKFLHGSKTRGENLTPVELKQGVALVRASIEIQQTLKAIEHTGSEAIYICCDINDQSSLAQALDAIRKRWGSIDGVVHGAGVLADKLLSAKTLAHFDRVFGTKVIGLQNLLSATEADTLKLLCLFSSVAARTGNPGQSDYAMANEVLNRVACSYAHVEDFKVVSINWGPWDSGMVDDGLKQQFTARGIQLIPLAQGADFFVNELLQDHKDIEVVVGGMSLDKSLSGREEIISHRFRVTVDLQKLPQLNSHRVKGSIVLPVVQVVDWFCILLNTLYPRAGDVVLTELSVLRGIVFENNHQDDDALEEYFTIDFYQDQSDEFHLALLDKNDQKRYQAKALFKQRSSSGLRFGDMNLHQLDYQQLISHNKISLPPGFNHTDPYEAKANKTSSYKKRLFHGPMFASLAKITGLSVNGASAILEGGKFLKWPEQSGGIDQAILDGALQLALLWGYEQLGLDSLPMSFQALHIGHHGFFNKPVRCVLLGQCQDKTGSQCDIIMLDENDKLVAQLQGLHMVCVADPLADPVRVQQ